MLSNLTTMSRLAAEELEQRPVRKEVSWRRRLRHQSGGLGVCNIDRASEAVVDLGGLTGALARFVVVQHRAYRPEHRSRGLRHHWVGWASDQ